MKLFSIVKDVNEIREGDLEEKLEEIQKLIEKITEAFEIEIIDINIKIRPVTWGKGPTHEKGFKKIRRLILSDIITVIKYHGKTIDLIELSTMDD